jgi:outer membrane biosynthesis protein TonB
MISATIVVSIWVMLVPGGRPLGDGVAPPQTAPAQQASQPASSPGQSTPVTPPAPALKPCPTVSSSTPSSPSDCTPVAKTRKHRQHKPTPPAPTDGPTKTVVNNGGTGEPAVAISSDVSQQQASRQLGNTNGLLAQTDQNLKIVAARQLSAAQQDTVNQIESYVKQSKQASDDGDLQRAYTLANKARMLSGDLVKH